jgi:hypothetical protein
MGYGRDVHRDYGGIIRRDLLLYSRRDNLTGGADANFIMDCRSLVWISP